jgi:hypothetical protein
MLNKEQKISKNVAKYGWRYEILDDWILKNRIPPAEKSVFSQLKARTQTFGEKIAKRLWEDHGIEGIYFPNHKSKGQNSSLSKIEKNVLTELRKLTSDDLKIEVLGFIKGLASTTEVTGVNDAPHGRDHTPAKKSAKAA